MLASRSPRRAELLTQAGIAFVAEPPEADETLPPGVGPNAVVQVLARRKAESVANRPAARDRFVLGADTLAFLDGLALGKPGGPGDAVAMLRALSGRTHAMLTGLALLTPDRTLVADVVRTDVTFRRLGEHEIEAYVATGEPLGKAGAYAIQGEGRGLVARIEGDRENVVGLPVRRVRAMLHEQGFRV